jgi:hypothetical protein
MKLRANRGEAEIAFHRSLAIPEKTLSPSHPKLIAGLNNLAQLYREAGREIEAVAMERRRALESA